VASVGTRIEPGRVYEQVVNPWAYFHRANVFGKELALGFSQSIQRYSGWGVRPGLCLAVLFMMVGGCETQSFFDPSEMGQYSKKPLPVPILKNLDTGIEEPDERFATAQDVQASDLVAVPQDYVIGRNDLLQVSITDLVQQGVETIKQMRVSESGYITLPLVGQVKALNLTEGQLEQAIVAAYKDANLIPNAQVSVVTVEARNRTFSILGAVQTPGQYVILQSDFRLLDALVLAKDVTNPVGIDYIYVVRQVDQDVKEGPTTAPAEGTPPTTQPGNDVLTPHSEVTQSPKMMLDAPDQAAAPATAPSGSAEGRIIVVGDKPMQIQGGQAVPMTESSTSQTAAPATPAAAAGGNFAFNDLREPSDLRVIRVPFDPLKRGELRYNIVIRPQDMILVPQPVVGEYYMGGHVQRTGVYSLTARSITLKQAVIAAGMLDPLAIPSRTQIVRRLSPNKEVFARVDLEKIFAGEEPDIILKPDDQVMVGTNAIAPFLAAFRQGFRITYGFGFLYDRNYFAPSGGNGGQSF
jgi:polysaccharide export outer membrane protein